MFNHSSMKRIITLLVSCFCIINVYAAYLRNIPMTLTQPDGTVLECFASGDEYFNYLHDEKGYTIMRNPRTGFWVYADKQGGVLVATDFVAGRVDPASKSLQPYNIISPQEWTERRNAWREKEKHIVNRDVIPNHGLLNNISIFIRFNDDEELTNSYYDIDNMFNDVTENAVSMRSYFRAASYGAIEIPTTFYPGHNDATIISYCDIYPRKYFEPYDATTNPEGYQDDDRADREFALLERAVNYINENYPIPSDLDIDYDDDGYVDNVCFIVKGGVGAWSSLLWPHKWAIYDREVDINGKRVWTFNFQLADATGYFNTSTMCHEMNHSLNAPDLYHYSYSGPSPIGIWDLMDNNTTPPQHCGAYMKMKYSHWVDEIPEITQAGTYTLNPISSPEPTNIAYKIASEDPEQFYVLEYRDKTSLFDAGLPGSGLLIYRIDTRFSGNADYNPSNGIYDEVYIFRPGGSTTESGDLNKAYFSSDVGRTEFSCNTSAIPFLTDGTVDYNLMIYNITEAGNTISFSYGSSSDSEAPTNINASVDENGVTLTWDAAANAQSYNIYRGLTLIGNTSETTFTDYNVVYGVYTYRLKSVDASGLLSTASEAVTVSLMPENSFIIGDEALTTSDVLPSYSYYNYALTQQIYTTEELGEAGFITGIAFYNGGAEKTRNFDFYMKSTNKSAFSGNSDWVSMKEEDKVFSGDVTMVADNWTFIEFSQPFAYDGSSNVVLVADDNTGSWEASPFVSCRVFNAPSQAIRVYSDDTNYNALSPNYTGTVMDVKNQLFVTKIIPVTDPFNVTVSAEPSRGGTVSGGGEYYYGDICTVTATANDGYSFMGWTENGQLVSNDLEFTFGVVQDRDLVATFIAGIVIGNGGSETNQYLPSTSNYKYTLSQQIYTADEIGTACTIESIAFYNEGSERTRNYDIYLVHTTYSSFSLNTDWIAVTEDDKVFSGDVVMVNGDWTVITFDKMFEYDGTNNLAVIIDDNTGSWNNGMKCRVFEASNQTLRVFGDGTNYNPSTLSSYSGTVMGVKNQIILGINMDVEQKITLITGWNWVSFNVEITLNDLKTALVEAVPGTYISIKSHNATTFYNNGWKGTLSSLDVAEEYMINVAADCEITLKGLSVDPSEHPITIKCGSNWIAYPLNENKKLSNAFGSFPMEGDIVKSKDKTALYNNNTWKGNLMKLEPGNGYIYKTSVTTDRILTF